MRLHPMLLCLPFFAWPSVVAAQTAAERSASGAAIDREIQPSPLSSDAEFLRRVHLDLTGKLPSADRAAAFLDDADPAKRTRLIDELLASPAYGRHFATVWRTAIVKRDEANALLDHEGFDDWLAQAFNDNRGWNAIVRDLLTVEGEVGERPAGFFFMANRDMKKIGSPQVLGNGNRIGTLEDRKA
jgi:hypothetical protein